MRAPVACSGDLGLAPCTGEVAVSVSSGVTPTISWSPACGAMGMQVLSAAQGGAAIWYIATSDGTNRMGSPVTYGRTPANATVLVAPQRLVVGQSYLAVILRADDPGAGQTSISGTGSVSFTP